MAKSKTPKLRFKGFNEDWEERKFEELVKLRRGLTYSPNDIAKTGIRVLRSSNISDDKFVLKNDDVFVKNSAVNIKKAINKNILITSANGSSHLVGKHAIIENITNDPMVHGGFMLLAETENPYFVNASMNSNWYKNFINLYVSGGNGAIGNLSKSDLENQEILLPNLKEQEKIGDFFKNLDESIALHERKCEKLKIFKKAMLDKMFPKNGEKTPEFRFKGFSEDWEECTLEEIATISKGQQLNKSDMVSFGKYYVLNGGISPSGYTDKYNTSKNTISISEGGNSCGYVNYNIKNFWSGGHNYTLTNIKVNSLFIYANLKKYEKEIMNLRVGTGLPNIQKTKLSKFIISISKSLKEQQKIGDFFKNLDNSITLNERKIEKLKIIKKAMLDKMFV